MINGKHPNYVCYGKEYELVIADKETLKPVKTIKTSIRDIYSSLLLNASTLFIAGCNSNQVDKIDLDKLEIVKS